jgi:phosphoribosylglycinamide formyltransferase-1
MKQIAIFASGKGTNAQNICNHFKYSKEIKVVLLCTNKKNAPVVSRLKKYSVPSFIFSKEELNNSSLVIEKLKIFKVDYIILSGFLIKIPKSIIDLFENKIINIHPSLLPKYGGRGMYGENVHRNVIENKEKESGVSVHFVNNNYDEGGIIQQEKCLLCEDETVSSLTEKIRFLEHQYFPTIIEKIITK